MDLQYSFEMTHFVLHGKRVLIPLRQLTLVDLLYTSSSSPPSPVTLQGKAAMRTKPFLLIFTRFFLAEEKQFVSLGHFD